MTTTHIYTPTPTTHKLKHTNNKWNTLTIAPENSGTSTLAEENEQNCEHSDNGQIFAY